MARKVDTTKKVNIKCEHCKYFCTDTNKWEEISYCGITGETKHYWNRCKSFDWHSRCLQGES